MSNLLKFNKDKLEINPFLYVIQEFKVIWDHDKSKDHHKALKDLAYIYYKADYKSEYLCFGNEIDEVLSKDIYDIDNFNPDKYIKAAIEKYILLQRTPGMVALENTRKALNLAIKRLNEEIVINENDDKSIKRKKLNNLSSGDILKTLKNITPIFDVLDDLDKRIYKEATDIGSKIMGGGEAGLFEDPEEYKEYFKDDE